MSYQVKPTSCSGCPWENVTYGYAAGSGPSTAKLAIIAESLGENEAAQGIPLVGYTGQEVNRFLQNHSVSRAEVYCDNIVRCKPPIGKGKKIPKDVIEFCTQRHLLPALSVVKPNTIIALGDYSLNFLSGRKGISKWRGSILWTPYGKVVPTYHPSWLHKGENAVIFYPFVDFDFAKAIEESETPTYDPPLEKFNIDPTIKDIQDAAVLARAVGKVSIDIETSGGSWWNTAPLCMGVYFAGINEAICIPFLGFKGIEIWSTEDAREVYQTIDAILSDNSIKKVLQNGMYDIQVLESCGFTVNNFAFDTMIAHHAVIAEKGVPHDLAFIGSIYTKTPYYKDDVKGEDNFALLPIKILRIYNCRDCMVTGVAEPKLDGEIDEYDVRKTFEQDMRLLRPLLKIQGRGIAIDTDLLDQFRREQDDKIAEAEIDLKKVLGNDFNPNSNAQVSKLLFEDLKLQPIDFTKFGRQPKVDFDSIMQLADQVPEELETLFILLLELRKAQKLRSTYFKEFILDNDGRLHTSYLLHITPTGRLSSRNPNLQNIPKGKPREMFVASPGYVFLARDYSQLELRILAELTQDQSLLDIFRSGGDVHASNASDLFGTPLSAVKEDERDASKIFMYGGIIYGGTAKTVRRQMLSRAIRRGNVNPKDAPTVEKVAKAQAAWFVKHPSVLAFQQEIEREVLATRKLRTCLGRVRHFLGKKENIIRAAYNFPIQGTASDIINPALTQLSEKIDEPSGLVLQEHDELVMEVLESEAEKYIELSKEIMEAPIDINGREVVFPTSCKIGKSWGKLEKYVKS